MISPVFEIVTLLSSQLALYHCLVIRQVRITQQQWHITQHAPLLNKSKYVLHFLSCKTLAAILRFLEHKISFEGAIFKNYTFTTVEVTCEYEGLITCLFKL